MSVVKTTKFKEARLTKHFNVTKGLTLTSQFARTLLNLEVIGYIVHDNIVFDMDDQLDDEVRSYYEYIESIE